MGQFLDLNEIHHPKALLFGARLKESRKALRMTQTELVALTGITPGYLSEIENGRANPTLDMMVKLSEALGVDVSILLRPDTEHSASRMHPHMQAPWTSDA